MMRPEKEPLLINDDTIPPGKDKLLVRSNHQIQIVHYEVNRQALTYICAVFWRWV